MRSKCWACSGRSETRGNIYKAAIFLTGAAYIIQNEVIWAQPNHTSVQGWQAGDCANAQRWSGNQTVLWPQPLAWWFWTSHCLSYVCFPAQFFKKLFLKSRCCCSSERTINDMSSPLGLEGITLTGRGVMLVCPNLCLL